MKLHTYLNFNGNCQTAFRFYEEHLGGKITAMMTHDQAPGSQAPEGWGSAILHARLTLGGTELLASDVPTDHFKEVHSSYLSLTTNSVEDAERIFPLLAKQGQVFMPLQQTFWALAFGTVRDRFGVLWMISAERPQQL